MVEAKDDIVMKYDKLQVRIAMAQGRKCDKYDYLIAIFCGAVAGIIDSVFVGVPGKGILGKWTDASTDSVIKVLAKKHGWAPRSDSETIGNAIKYFENKYPVNYDQSYGQAAGQLLGMSARNHHIKSLAHAPDIIGLLFSVLDQFTDTSHFLDNGRLITFDTQTSSLRGCNNPYAKIFAGICNWFWHIISDFAGSSNRAEGLMNRGSGVSIPFFEMFQLCDFGEFTYAKSAGTETVTLADFSVKLFEEGYDARFGLTMALPLLLNDLIIRFLWGMKQKFYHKKQWKDCIPGKEHPDLRLMLIVGNATLCLIDGLDAGIRSKGNLLNFFLHFNMIAWFKLSVRIFKEIQIRFNFSYEDMKLQFEYLNYQMQAYLEQLKSIDYDGYYKQLAELDGLACLLEVDIERASSYMSDYIEAHNIETDFQDFDTFFSCIDNSDGIIKW